MSESEFQPEKEDSNSLNKKEILSFKPLGRPLTVEEVFGEFEQMKAALKNSLTAVVARRICEKSGSHLIKLVSPRVDGEHAVLRVDAPNSNRKSTLLPSVNAPDIPYCKVVFRPLEIEGFPAMSVVDHILNPEGHSARVLGDFATVFGDDVLAVMREVLLSPPSIPLKLGAGEFPIIFVPRPGGGDLQVTPVSPATSFMGMRDLFRSRKFQKKDIEGPRVNRGHWVESVVSSKLQNISGAIGGPRVRFLVTMPPTLQQGDAELYRFAHGGGFPRWRDDEVAIWVLRYAEMLEADRVHNNQDTRAALDRTADRLIRDAVAFIEETLLDAKGLAEDDGKDVESLPSAPTVPQVLIRRHWGGDANFEIARKALSSPHFEDRLRKSRSVQEVAQ